MKQCTRSGTLEFDGNWFCKTHHPPTIKAKTIAREKAWEAEWDAKAKQQAEAKKRVSEIERKARAYDRLMDELFKYSDPESAISIAFITEMLETTK